MTTMRLYRELCRESQPADKNSEVFSKSDKPRDITFQAERVQLLFDLGFEVQGATQDPVKKPKYHGKAVRVSAGITSIAEIRAKKERDQKIRDISRKLNETMVQTTRLQETVNVIKDCAVSNKLIPRGILPKLSEFISKDDSKINELGAQSASAKQLNSPPRKQTESLSNKEVSPCPVVMKLPSIERRGFKRDFLVASSKHKWSKEEREKLNEIYLEVEKPRHHNPASWNSFYINIAKRFSAFYPRRSEAEVVSKLHDLVSRRLMIEDGEKEYWDGFR